MPKSSASQSLSWTNSCSVSFEANMRVFSIVQPLCKTAWTQSTEASPDSVSAVYISVENRSPMNAQSATGSTRPRCTSRCTPLRLGLCAPSSHTISVHLEARSQAQNAPSRRKRASYNASGPQSALRQSPRCAHSPAARRMRSPLRATAPHELECDLRTAQYSVRTDAWAATY